MSVPPVLNMLLDMRQQQLRTGWFQAAAAAAAAAHMVEALLLPSGCRFCPKDWKHDKASDVQQGNLESHGQTVWSNVSCLVVAAC